MKGTLVLTLFLVTCSQQKSFSRQAAIEEDNHPSAIVDEQSSSVATAVTSLDSCVEGDRAIVSWAGPIKECMDSGRTWHFETKSCVDMPKAIFICDWDTIQDKLKELNLLSDTLKADAASGAKLVSCSQSADGNRIAVQWLKPVGGVSCQNLQEGLGVTTGCYTHYVDRQSPPPATTEAEKRQRVNECLQNL